MNTLKRHPLLVFYGVALLFAGLWEELSVLYGAGNPVFSVLTLFLASYGPTVGTLVTLALLRDPRENAAWRRRLFTFRVNWRWYLLALLLPACAWLAGTALSTLFGGHFPFHPFLLVVFPFLLLANAGEEVGWRGFALPLLLQRFNGLTASLLLGSMWGLFHLPLYSQALSTFLPFLCLLIAVSILMTWVFNATSSIPLMICMHASMDTIQFVSPVNETALPIVAFALIALVLWLIACFVLLRVGPNLGGQNKPDVALAAN